MKKITCLIVLLAVSMFQTPASAKELLGAGATFPYPYYSKLFDTYNKSKGVETNYQAIGSGGGIRQLLKKTVDFGGTDAFMKEKDLKKAEGDILHMPTCLGAVVVSYNLPGDLTLNLTPEIISGIFLGEIKKWNDEKIQASNKSVILPDTNIVVVHRSDGSGTTAIFSDYLSKVSKEWKETVGAGKSLNWPAGLGAKGNSGVAGLIKQVPGSVGYVELIYAVSNNMSYANIQNKSGNFIAPSIETVSLAANVALPDDTRVSITDTDSKDGYPISGFTWLIFYKEQNYAKRDKAKAETLLNMLWWVLHDGQALAKPIHYAPLSAEAVKKGETILKSVTYKGKALLK